MTRRERRVVLAGAVAVVVILLATLASRLREAAADDAGRLEVERVARLRGLAASVDTLRVAAASAGAVERGVAARYLSGGTAAVAAAQLSAEVRRLAETVQVEILREGVLPARDAGRASAVSLQITARTDAPGLLDFLAALDGGPLLLAVDDLAVSSDPRERPGAASLTVTLQVTGYLLGLTPTPQEAP